MLLLATLTAVSACILVLLGALGDQPLLQAAGVLVGIATGVLLCWAGGRIAARSLAPPILLCVPFRHCHRLRLLPGAVACWL
jgi:xanthine/uracil permease